MINNVNLMNVENEELCLKCVDLYKNFDQVVKVVIGSVFVQCFLLFMEISGYFRLSDNFFDGYMIIIGVDDFSMYIQGGEYVEMV